MSNQSIDVVGSHPSIGPNDVLLGRGNHLHICGNERFRSLVRSRSVEYWSCNDNVMKDNIARQIVDSITAQHGRFLRKVKKTPSSVTNPGGDTASARDSSVAVPTEQWEVADTETILVKVKQTFRDFTASNKKKAGASAHMKQSLPSYEQTLSLPEMSILERLQNSTNVSSFPLATLPDSNDSSWKVSSPVAFTGKTDTNEMLFQNARAAQLGHLAHNAQQQLINETSQDQQLMTLFEQQRAILMKQLQQSQFIQPTQPPPQPEQHSQNQITSHQQQLSMQPAPSSLRQESTRLLPGTAQHLSPILLNQLMYQSQQDQFLQGRHNLVQQSHLIDQLMRGMSRSNESSSYQPPQYSMTNQNAQQNQILSSMNLNAMPNIQNWSQQPSWHNLPSISAPLPVIPTLQSQSASSTHSNYVAEHLNEFLNQSNVDVPTSVTHRMNMSSNRIANNVTAISGEAHLPGAMSCHQPPLPQVPVAISTGAVYQSSSICHDDDSDSRNDDKKPPGL